MAVDIIARAMAASVGKNILPEVTAEDNGKVLGVEDGAWTKITPESGAIPTITIDPSQIISGEPLIIQLTAEQAELFLSDAPVIKFILIDMPMMLFATANPRDRATVLRPFGSNRTSAQFISASLRGDNSDECHISDLTVAIQQESEE